MAREIDEAFRLMNDFADKGYPDSSEMWENIYYTLIRVRDRLIDYKDFT